MLINPIFPIESIISIKEKKEAKQRQKSKFQQMLETEIRKRKNNETGKN